MIRKAARTLALALAFLPAPPAAADFAPVTERDKSLTEVPGAPNAPAVVLFKNADFWMMDLDGKRKFSRLEVQVRRKILTEEGKQLYGEITVPHSRAVRLGRFEGRTVLPDGRVVPLPADAVFERRASRSEKTFETAAAFPAVEVGAILDYRYELRFDSIFLLEPWYFQSEVPTLHSEIVYHVPDRMGLKPWARTLPGQPIQNEMGRDPDGRKLRFWMTDLPAVIEEPLSYPFADLSSRLLLVPSFYELPGQRLELLDSWETLCDLVEEQLYQDARRADRKAVQKAREIAGTVAGGAPEEVARALYRFVRDEVATDSIPGVLLVPGSKIDDVLTEGRGDYAEKALLLQAMLAAVKVDGRLVWAGNRFDGQVDPELPNPEWFERMLVRLDLGGREIYLDPADRRLAFGRLSPGLEGTTAVLYDRKKPQVITLPMTPFADSRRRAVLALAVDGEGRASGRGELELTGHHAWSSLLRGDTPDKTVEAWREWLEARHPGFEIAEVEVDEAVAEQRLALRWAMSQRPEEVLGDELSLLPSRPLGPVEQAFQLPPERRRTPVLLPFADRDEVEITLSWPEGWGLEAAPRPLHRTNAVGEVVVAVERPEGERRLTYSRRFDIKEREILGGAAYESLRTLYGAMEASDAEALVLVQR